MKAFLVHPNRDFDLRRPLPWNEQALMQDLGLGALFDAMAQGDSFLSEVARVAVLSSLTDVQAIEYRQRALADCIEHEAVVREAYQLAVEAIEKEKKSFWGFWNPRYPAGILHRGVDALQMFIGMLRRLRAIADQNAAKFKSDAFSRLFTMLQAELGDDYFARMEEHLERLRFRDGILISAQLGKGNKGENYVLRKASDRKPGWLERIFSPRAPRTFYLHPRDESGARALSELRDQGVNLVANALAQSTDHILSFFQMLRTELAFYVGCLNLHRELVQKGEPWCFPIAKPLGERAYFAKGLYDVSLALSVAHRVVGNDVDANSKDLMIMTGANQGGKSTLLRAIGLAQLMMQAGMFVPARSFSADVRNGLVTHYKREEDVTMKSGKLDEELSRMNEIAGKIGPGAMVLFNESFAATNEREGSEIASQVTRALIESGVKVFFVTHLYEFARALYDRRMPNAIFLRAERRADGTRTFRLFEGEPLQTSYGKDLYDSIFASHSPTEMHAAAE
jgi:DNA mismatch repair ATPase MutS